MNKKMLMALILCGACLVSGCGKKESAQDNAGAAALEAETEVKTKAQEEALTEEAAESVLEETEGLTEAETEEVIPERPDYKALDYVTLGTYKGLALTDEPVSVTEDEINAEISTAFSASGLEDVMETPADDTVQVGDTVNIDFEGTIDGEAFDGGTSEAVDLVIGSGMFIPGFEEGLVGAHTGDKLDVPVTFPENYSAANLAGQDAVFAVTVNSISRPKLTDEAVKDVSGGVYDTVEGFRTYIEDGIRSGRETQKDNAQKEELMAQLYNTCKVNDYPQDLLDYTVNGLERTYTEYASMYGMSLEDFLSMYMQMTAEDFETAAEDAAKDTLTQEMILKGIAEQEEITISDDEFSAGCEEYAAKYGYESGQEIIDNYDPKIIEVSLLQDKVLEFLKDNAVIEEVTEEVTEEATEEAAEEETAEALEAAEELTEAVTEAVTE